jgi:hypothetical protein
MKLASGQFPIVCGSSHRKHFTLSSSSATLPLVKIKVCQQGSLLFRNYGKPITFYYYIFNFLPVFLAGNMPAIPGKEGHGQLHAVNSANVRTAS